jgi:hypothetical protein
MVPCTRDGGTRTKPMEEEDSFMLMVMSTMATGSMIRHMVLACIAI